MNPSTYKNWYHQLVHDVARIRPRVAENYVTTFTRRRRGTFSLKKRHVAVDICYFENEDGGRAYDTIQPVVSRRAIALNSHLYLVTSYLLGICIELGRFQSSAIT